MTNLGILLSCVFDGGFFYRVYYYRVFLMGFFFYREYEMYRPRAHLRKGRSEAQLFFLLCRKQ